MKIRNREGIFNVIRIEYDYSTKPLSIIRKKYYVSENKCWTSDSIIEVIDDGIKVPDNKIITCPLCGKSLNLFGDNDNEQ